MFFVQPQLILCFPLYLLLGIRPLLCATNEDNSLDLELRLAPPRTDKSSKEATQIADQSLKQLQGHFQTLDRGMKRKGGRPRLDLTEEERTERKKKRIQVKNRKYRESVNQNPELREKHLKRKREHQAKAIKIQMQDPKRSAEIRERRRRNKRAYIARKKLKKLNEKSNLQE
ncbi:uncharacterized protein FA14DRAFT_155556 [Meira miltonrushii]|uniref:BZIP domain-containing protein n=1 Tax=Meira miltonrushii TaxID=1280837 RepID=A0A316VKU7_9BASI|nr:uncharacterized protein FA14DRAFT_155556 [Meira miltonrushii]PWN36155.1 hypothetical protein FA14DRAFT_155556 [Meira miltonrushii]